MRPHLSALWSGWYEIPNIDKYSGQMADRGQSRFSTSRPVSQNIWIGARKWCQGEDQSRKYRLQLASRTRTAHRTIWHRQVGREHLWTIQAQDGRNEAVVSRLSGIEENGDSAESP